MIPLPNRILKESILRSDSIDRLTPFEETVFYRLIVRCDDYGRWYANPKLLASELFPLREEIRAPQMEEALRSLEAADLIILYEAEGKALLQLKTWDKHQQVRAKRSKFPPPESEAPPSDGICDQTHTDDGACPRNPIQSESDPNPDTDTKGRFTPPARGELAAYIAQNGYRVDPDLFLAHYESNGWRVGRNPMRNWRAAVRSWAGNAFDGPGRPAAAVSAQRYTQRSYEGEEEINDLLDWIREDREVGG